MRLATVVVGGAMVMWASAAAAQARPDFSGKWTVDAEKTQAANPAMQGGGGGGGGGGRGFGGMNSPMTITQDANTLTTSREGQNGAVSTAYKLDGTETTITSQRGDSKATAKWDGNALVVTTVRPGMDGAPMTSTATYAKEGDYLVVTTHMNTPNGEFTRKTYYTKG